MNTDHQPPRPILFLDFDGVLHPDDVYHFRDRGIVLKTANRVLFDRADALADVLALFPAWRIVLSTTWVRVLSYSRAVGRLLPRLQERVVGATWHSAMPEDEWLSLTRYQQIARYVARHHVQKWVAIDDDTRGWPPSQRRHLVATASHLGLTEAKLRELVRKLAQ